MLQPLGDLWRLMDRFDLAICHGVRRSSYLVQHGWQVETPYAFPQMNSGVMLYRRVPAIVDFLRKWGNSYVQAGAARDQVTLRDLLWPSDLRFYVLPPEFILLRVTELDA